MLEVEDLHAYYGKSHILQGVRFAVGEGEIVALLGRNGAGRSTTIKTLMGEVRPHGAIRFSLSRYTTDAEIDLALKVLPAVINRLRAVLPVGA